MSSVFRILIVNLVCVLVNLVFMAESGEKKTDVIFYEFIMQMRVHSCAQVVAWRLVDGVRFVEYKSGV